MNYCAVKEIESIYNIKEMLNLSRLFWYRLAEGIEIIPNSYIDYHKFITDYENGIFFGWKLSIKGDGALSLTRMISTTVISIQINRSGKGVFKII